MYIKMIGDNTKYQGHLERVGAHLIKVSGLIQHTTGFMLYLDNNVLAGDYSKFIYPYLDPNLGEGVYMYSDNNATYKEDEGVISKEDAERQKIIGIINEYVGNDLKDLKQEAKDLNDIINSVQDTMEGLEQALYDLYSALLGE
jgi:hypothetical protein